MKPYKHQGEDRIGCQSFGRCQQRIQIHTDCFLKQIVNMHCLIANCRQEEKLEYFGKCSVMKHLMVVGAETIEYSHNNKTIVDTLSRTDRTLAEQDSQYLNYLKQYQTVVKNSRRKEYISPVQQKQEMNQLITQFLSDLRSQGSRIHQQSQKSISSNGFKITPVKIQRIDLGNIKPIVKNNKEIFKKEQKDKETSRTNGRTQEVSPRFANITEKMILKRDEMSKGKKTQKSTQKLKIEVIKVHTPKKNNIKISPATNNKQLPPQPTQQFSTNKLQSNADCKQSYLKKYNATQKVAQPKKIDSVFRNPPEASCNYTPASQNKQNNSSKLPKKPIKIQIQIPLDQLTDQKQQHYLQGYEMQSSVELEQEQQCIIKEISQKIMTLLNKTGTSNNRK